MAASKISSKASQWEQVVPADASVEPGFAECSLEHTPDDLVEAELRRGLGGQDVAGGLRAAAGKRLLTLEHA